MNPALRARFFEELRRRGYAPSRSPDGIELLLAPNGTIWFIEESLPSDDVGELFDMLVRRRERLMWRRGGEDPAVADPAHDDTDAAVAALKAAVAALDDHGATIAALEALWAAEPPGFFWNVRQRQLVARDGEAAIAVLRAIPGYADGATLPARLVSLLWFIPVFMEWNADGVRRAGGDDEAYTRVASELTSEVMRILGAP